MIPQSRLTRWVLPFLLRRDERKCHRQIIKANAEQIERISKMFSSAIEIELDTAVARKPEQVTDQFEERYGEKNW